jgi:hypothetical protein
VKNSAAGAIEVRERRRVISAAWRAAHPNYMAVYMAKYRERKKKRGFVPKQRKPKPIEWQDLLRERCVARRLAGALRVMLTTPLPYPTGVFAQAERALRGWERETGVKEPSDA